MKKVISFMLALGMLAGSFTGVSFAAEEAAEDTRYRFPYELKETVFASSFEGNGGNYQDVTSLKDSYTAKPSATTEVPDYLFDGNVNTKYLTTFADDQSCYVSFKMNAMVRVDAYAVTSANDWPTRDPYMWKLYGSNDGKQWTVVDSQTEIEFEDRLQTKVFQAANPQAYLYYHFVVEKTRGFAESGTPEYLQYSELALYAVSEEQTTKLIFTPDTIYGETEGITLSDTIAAGGSKGLNALKVEAKHQEGVKGTGYALLYDNVNVPVTENTVLSYCIRPESVGEYDEEYPGHYIAVDLVFTDGTRLSQLEVTDQNGHVVSPSEQGKTKALITTHWNYIAANLAKAKGKTIDKILVGYERDVNETGAALNALAYIDDLRIEEAPEASVSSKTQYVKTTRGTYGNGSISRGACYPGVRVPNGFMTVTPATSNGNRTIYDYTANKMPHFTVTHQANTHLLDYNQFQFMPNTTVSAKTATVKSISAGNRTASFSHDKEIDRPHYYGVEFDNYTAASGVKAELTTTDHCVMAQFTFPDSSSNRNIIFDSVGAEVPSTGSIDFKDDGTFTATVKNGHDTFTNGYATMYICGRFSQKPTVTRSFKSGLATGIVGFDQSVKTVTMTFSSSFISPQQAEKNLALEINENAEFYAVAEKSQAAWDEILNVIDVEGASKEEKISLYSSLYRMYSYPVNYSENTGTAEQPKLQYMSPYTQTVTDGQLYTGNGFWDTYRTAWPAYSLLTPTKAGQLIDGILQHYKDSGEIARWLSPAGIPSMVGSSSDVVFADAAVKGVKFDYETAFESIVKNAATTQATGIAGRINQERSLFLGYVTNEVGTSVSWQIENNISDYAAGIFAGLLGKTDYQKYLLNRSLGYTYLFEPKSGFFISKNPDGKFTAEGDELDPYLWNPNVYGHIETNAWGTAFNIPFDGEGLAALYGGKEALAAKLDAMLTANQSCTSVIGSQHEMIEGRECKMGQYWHSNQPAYASLYLYNTASQPYKTQAYVREVLDRLYIGSSYGQGYLGDDDNGTSSAWYVMSALGFYPLSLGSGQYAVTSPLFDKVTLHLESGDVEIIANNNSAQNVYIQTMTVDGKAWNTAEISHETLIHAKRIEFTMGNQPSTWGTKEAPVHSSLTVGADPVPMQDLVQKDFPLRKKLDLQGGNYVWNESGSNSNLRLYDNSMAAAALETDTVGVSFASPKAVKLFTVASYTVATAPVSVTVYASKTGADDSWVALASRELDFTFNNQVVPVDLNNNEAYSYYRAVFKAPEGKTAYRIAELEWLGYEQSVSHDKADLQQLTQAADLLIEKNVVTGDAEVTAALQDGKRVVENKTVSDYNCNAVYERLSDALLKQVTREVLDQALKGIVSTVRYGDVNDDGVVNAADALLVLKAAVGKTQLTEMQKAAAELNGDKKIDAKDALLILQYAVKKIQQFPCETL